MPLLISVITFLEFQSGSPAEITKIELTYFNHHHHHHHQLIKFIFIYNNNNNLLLAISNFGYREPLFAFPFDFRSKILFVYSVLIIIIIIIIAITLFSCPCDVKRSILLPGSYPDKTFSLFLYFFNFTFVNECIFHSFSNEYYLNLTSTTKQPVGIDRHMIDCIGQRHNTSRLSQYARF
jgi:hypothetical protein